MRYVGRHRAPRPLLLRRPVVGGAAAVVLLAAPVLYTLGDFGQDTVKGTSHVTDGAAAAVVNPTGTPVSIDDNGATVIPTDGALPTTNGPRVPSTPTATGGVPYYGGGSGSGVGMGGGSGNGGSGGGSGHTTTHTTSPVRTTSKPVKTTRRPVPTTSKPPVVVTTTTTPPVVDPTTPTPDPGTGQNGSDTTSVAGGPETPTTASGSSAF